jgi:hypothetical protein
MHLEIIGFGTGFDMRGEGDRGEWMASDSKVSNL